MKKLISLFLALLIPGVVFAQVGATASVWDQAAAGTASGVTYVKVTGVNPAPTTTFEPVWAPSVTYTPKVVAITSPICASTSANDTAAGTGARTISVTGLNTSFARFTETVTLNGQTVVAMTTANILFIDKITVATAGSGLVNAGIVSCGDTDGGSGVITNIAQSIAVSSATAIAAAGAGGGNVSEAFFYGVPVGYNLVCRNLTMSTYLATTVIGIQAVVDGYTNSTGVLKRYASLYGNNAGGNGVTDPKYMVFPEKTLVLGRMAVTSAAPAVLSMECLLISTSGNAGPNF